MLWEASTARSTSRANWVGRGAREGRAAAAWIGVESLLPIPGRCVSLLQVHRIGQLPAEEARNYHPSVVLLGDDNEIVSKS